MAIEPLDVAIVGAGAAGTYLADRLGRCTPGLVDRDLRAPGRVGGRVWSVAVLWLARAIELGGMRFLTQSHTVVQSAVIELGIPTRPYDTRDGSERLFPRGRLATDPAIPPPVLLDDPGSGRAGALGDGPHGRGVRADRARGADIRSGRRVALRATSRHPGAR